MWDSYQELESAGHLKDVDVVPWDSRTYPIPIITRLHRPDDTFFTFTFTSAPEPSFRDPSFHLRVRRTAHRAAPPSHPRPRLAISLRARTDELCDA